MAMSTLETLRITVAALRQATGETQAILAAGVGLTQDKVSRRQSGAAAWTLDDCDALATHFGITLAELLAGPTSATHALNGTRERHADGEPTAQPEPEPVRPDPGQSKRYQVQLACGDTIGRDFPPMGETTTCPAHGRQQILSFDDTGRAAE